MCKAFPLPSGVAGLPASIPGLPGIRAWVNVGPPLSRKAPRSTSTGLSTVPIRSPVVLLKPHPELFPIRLYPREIGAPSQSPLLGALFPVMMVFASVVSRFGKRHPDAWFRPRADCLCREDCVLARRPLSHILYELIKTGRFVAN